MRKPILPILVVQTMLVLSATVLGATGARKVNYQPDVSENLHSTLISGPDGLDGIPSPPRLNQVGTIIDSTIYDYQFSILGQRIASVGDSALHMAVMVSPDVAFSTRGMKYLYYFNGVVTNFGYVEGDGSGAQRGGFGSVIGYNASTLGLGNVAIITSHTNLSDRPMGAHWYSFQDAFQGVGAFTAYEGWWGDGVSECQAIMWPSIAAVDDATGSMAMVGRTGDVSGGCQGGTDDIYVTQKNFVDTAWGDGMLLDTLDDPAAWSGAGPNSPRIVASDDGHMFVVSSEFGTNVYYWESTDAGVSWGARQDVTGFPIGDHNLPPDSSSTAYRPLQNHAIGMSPDGVPHIVWTAYQARGNSPSDSTYTPGTSSLWQYRTKLEHWDPVNGINTIYRHPNGVADFAGGTQYFAYNVARPCIGFAEGGQTIYVVYEGFVDADQDMSNGIYYGDIYASVSTDGGATWKDRVNITDTMGSDDLFPAIAPSNIQGAHQELPGFSLDNADGVNDFIMIYQNDDVAGTFLGGEESSPNWDMLLLAPVDLDTISAAGIGGSGGEGTPRIPRSFSLAQNYPNPFNPSTVISYRLAESAEISLSIHNIRGQMVRELVSGPREAGVHAVQWDGRDELGQKVSSGIYLYSLETQQGFRSTKKMVILK